MKALQATNGASLPQDPADWPDEVKDLVREHLAESTYFYLRMKKLPLRPVRDRLAWDHPTEEKLQQLVVRSENGLHPDPMRFFRTPFWIPEPGS